MARGSKTAYTQKQERQAEHIEEGYEARGIDQDEAVRRAWATVNKISGGGRRGKAPNKAPMRKGGRLGGKTAHRRNVRKRSPTQRGTRATV